MQDRLNYLKDVLGIGLFTASSGMGKSHSMRCFKDSLNENLYDMHYICLSTVSVGEFYKLLCEELGLAAQKSKACDIGLDEAIECVRKAYERDVR